MKIRDLVAAACTIVCAINAAAQTTFTYQGRLTQNGAITQGPTTRMLTFQLCDAASSGNVLSSTTLNVVVTDSLFTQELNFPYSLFDGGPRWLQIRIGDVNGTALAPRQKITAVPYAYYALRTPPQSTLAAPDGSPNPAVSVDVNGAVGVGTAAPDSELHIADDAAATFAPGSGVLQIGPTAVANLLFDGDEILPRNNGQPADMFINTPGLRVGDPGAYDAYSTLHVESTAGASGLRVRFDANTKLIVTDNGGTSVGSGTSGPANGLRVAGDAYLLGNVGVGTATPAQRLSVAGTIQSTTGGFMFPDGTVQTTSAAPVVETHYLAIPPSAYRAADSQLVVDFTDGLRLEYEETPTPVHFATVHLPDGAVVTELQAYFEWSSGSVFEWPSIQLWRAPLFTDAAPAAMASRSTPDCAPPLPPDRRCTFTDATINGAVINNSQYSYYLIADTTHDQSVGGSLTTLWGTRITYTIEN